MNLTERAHQRLSSLLSEGDIVIDATAGNGHDTLFLAQKVGPTGHVFAFDVQPQAIENTKLFLHQHNVIDRLSVFLEGHEKLSELIPSDSQQKISVIMFNLGYLPGSDKTCKTQTKTTLLALKQSLSILKPDGVISIMLYPGHKGGDEETSKVMAWVEQHTAVYIIEKIQTKGPQWLLLGKKF